jgi:glycosyltransferase involved in cell wall biosynthesis
MDNLEIIIIDDGSTDGSRDYLQQQTKNRDNLIVVLETGIGPGAARNVGVQVSSGHFLAFLDADDRWSPKKLAKQWAYMRLNPNTVLSFTNYDHLNEGDDNTIISCFDYWPEFQATILSTGQTSHYRILNKATAAIFKENVIGTSSVMCQREAYLLVGGFDTELPSASDWDLWLKLSKIGDVAFTTEIGMNYLMRAGSVSSNFPKRISAIKTISQRHLNDAQKQNTNAQKFVAERLSDAYCDHASESGTYINRLLKHAHSFTFHPSIRRLKALLKCVLPLSTTRQ